MLTARTDSVWGALASYLVTLGDRYDAKAGLERQTQATRNVWAIMWRESKTLEQVLNPAQLKLLPWPAAYLKTADKPPAGMRASARARTASTA